MAIAQVRRMNSGRVAKSRRCSVERVLAVQHKTWTAAGRQKFVVETEEACGFGGSDVVGDRVGGGEGDAAKVKVD
jgi:hypothetical protein